MRRAKTSGLPPINESDWLQQVLDIAAIYGWRVAHFRPAQDGHGRWKTPVQGEGTGFPDLVLARPRISPAQATQVLYAELKSEDGQPTAEEHEWLETLQQAGGSAWLWRPSDLAEVASVLRGQPAVQNAQLRPSTRPTDASGAEKGLEVGVERGKSVQTKAPPSW